MEIEAEGDSDYALSAMSSTKKSRKGRGSKHNTPVTPSASDSGSSKYYSICVLMFYVLLTAFETATYFMRSLVL